MYLGVKEMQAICMKAVTNKTEKEKKVLKYNFLLKKSSQQRKTARRYKTPMKSNIVTIGFYLWLFLLDFMQTEIAY